MLMLVNATLGIKNTDLFVLSSSSRKRSVSIKVVNVCLFGLGRLCTLRITYKNTLYICVQVKIQVSKETLGGIPFWIIIISVLIGLLILALVIFILWKVIV